MSNSILNGFILAMENKGGVFVKMTADSIFFDVAESSEISDQTKLLRMKKAFQEICGLTLKVKTIVNDQGKG